MRDRALVYDVKSRRASAPQKIFRGETMRSVLLSFTALALLAAPAPAKTIEVAPGDNAQERVQTALIDAQPGDVVHLAAGRYELTDGLSLDVNNVTVQGDGPD